MEFLLESTGNIGQLYEVYKNDQKFLFNTLEPLIPVIAAGRYELVLYDSPKHFHKCNCPLPFYVLLLKEPTSKGHFYEMHIGNTIKDTEACICIGDIAVGNILQNSAFTFIKFIQHIMLNQNQRHYLTINRLDG